MVKKKRKSFSILLGIFLMVSVLLLSGSQEVKASQVDPSTIKMSFDNMFVGTGSKGFHPSKGNYLAIRAGVSFESEHSLYANVNVRLRVLNESGKYVYQKFYSNVGGTNVWGWPHTSWENEIISLNWNGKASKKNNAGVKYGSYVPDGAYKVELFFYVKDRETNDYIKTVTKKKSFKISSKAPSGSAGVAAAKTLPEYTGIENVDYMAEKMIQSAGVKMNMSQDEKVRRIYHWMTVNFKHKHNEEFDKSKKYYDLTSTSARKRIQAYRTQTLQNYYKGKLTFQYSFMNSFDEEYMQKRAGQCTTNADIFRILCEHVGVDAGLCNGYYKNLSGTTAVHSWSYAVVNGYKYYYDVDVEIQNYGKGQGDYYWYKKTRAQANQNHIFE